MILAAEVGINPNEFWDLTERELMAAINGYRRRQTEEWKRARLTAYMTYAVNVKNPEKIESWLPLEGDPQPKAQSKRKLKQLNKLADKLWPT